MTAAVSASDAVMLEFLEQESLSAVSLAGQVTFVLNLFITVAIQGTTVLAAQYWGKGNRQMAGRILGLALQYMFLASMVFLCVAVFWPRQLMGIFTNDRELVARGAEYLRIAGASYMPLGISQVYLCIMKNSGKTAKITVIGSSSMILNVIFNVVFIFGAFGVIIGHMGADAVAANSVANIVRNLIVCVTKG